VSEHEVEGVCQGGNPPAKMWRYMGLAEVLALQARGPVMRCKGFRSPLATVSPGMWRSWVTL
jgi:hypothetical protein